MLWLLCEGQKLAVGEVEVLWMWAVEIKFCFIQVHRLVMRGQNCASVYTNSRMHFVTMEGHCWHWDTAGQVSRMYSTVNVNELLMGLLSSAVCSLLLPSHWLTSAGGISRFSSSLCRCVLLVQLFLALLVWCESCCCDVREWLHTDVFLAAAPKGCSSCCCLCAPVDCVGV